MRALIGFVIAGIGLMASACASAPPPPPSVDVTGNWAGTWAAYEGVGGGGEVRGKFAQTGATLYGDFDIIGQQGTTRTAVSGTVTGNEVRLTAPSTGVLTVTEDQMVGIVYGLVHSKVTLRRLQ